MTIWPIRQVLVLRSGRTGFDFRSQNPETKICPEFITADKKQVNSCVLKNLFWWTSATRKFLETPRNALSESDALLLSRYENFVQVQVQMIKSDAEDLMIQDLILRTRLCGTGFINQHGWFVHFRLTKMVRWKWFVTVLNQLPRANRRCWPFNPFPWFRGSQLGSFVDLAMARTNNFSNTLLLRYNAVTVFMRTPLLSVPKRILLKLWWCASCESTSLSRGKLSKVVFLEWLSSGKLSIEVKIAFIIR